MSLIGVGRRLLLFGGGVFAQSYYNDVWQFDTSPSVAAPAPMALPRFATAPLASHLASLIASERFADVSICLADGGPPIAAHRMLLCSQTSDYFQAALAGPWGVREATDVGTHDPRITLTMPDSVGREAVLVFLRWCYTGQSPELPLDPELRVRAGGDLDGGGAVSDDAIGGAPDVDITDQAADSSRDTRDVDSEQRRSARVVSALVAADALGIEGLRAVCEAWLAANVDATHVCDILALSEELHCERLTTFCLEWLREQLGAWRRRGALAHAVATPGDSEGSFLTRIAKAAAEVGGTAALAPEAVHALTIARINGFERLDDDVRRRVAWAVGIPAEAFRGTPTEIEAAAETAARRGLVAGAPVHICNLKGRTDLNGRVGTLVEPLPTGRWKCRVSSPAASAEGRGDDVDDEHKRRDEIVQIKPECFMNLAAMVWW